MTEEDPAEPMAEIDHTHPHTDEPFGEPYRRDAESAGTEETGEPVDDADRDADTPEIRTDGGEPLVDDERGARRTATMAEVDHAGPVDVSSAFERGRVRSEERE